MEKSLSEINEMSEIIVIQGILHGVDNSININYLNDNSIVVTDVKNMVKVLSFFFGTKKFSM